MTILLQHAPHIIAAIAMTWGIYCMLTHEEKPEKIKHKTINKKL